MIDLREKRRRSKRKFHEAVEENGCPTQPKETILDMSVSKLAKAKTRINLEPSLRKTVMIVNTIRKIEKEIENGKGQTPDEEMCVDRRVTNTNRTCPDTRPAYCKKAILQEKTSPTDTLPMRVSLSLEKKNESCVCQNNSETLDSRFHSFDVTLAKSPSIDETFIDISAASTTQNFKNKLVGKCSSTRITTAPIYRDLPRLEESEINFSEIDISLYDFDTSVAWSEAGSPLACSDLEDNDSVYKTNTGLSALIRRCSDDLKLSKTTDNSFTDDLDQIMQVLVGI